MYITRRISFLSSVLLSLALAGCGSDGPVTPTTDGGPGVDLGPGADLGPRADAGTPPALRTLATADWTVPPNDELYVCVLVTIPDEIFVSEFHPLIPAGTHHTVLTFAPPGAGPDGMSTCDGFTNGPRMIYGSGLGTDPLIFPEGVAVRIPAGSQLLLNLHLFNFDATPLRGTSAVMARTVSPAAVVHEAEMTLAGVDARLNVAARSVSTANGTCTVRADTTMFALFPHMHQTAIHQKVTVMRDAVETIVMDDDYTFDEQYYRLISPGVQLRAGDQIHVACTYDNPSEARTFGESSNDEMCYAGVYVYPAGSFFLTCTD